MKLGRNDPCHCGSGKKYKRCHLAEDERRAWVAPVREPLEDEYDDRRGLPSPAAPGQILRMLETLASKGSARDRAEFSQILGAISQLEREEEPAQNHFLLTLCFLSVRGYGEVAGPE